jgi:manganese transport protein
VLLISGDAMVDNMLIFSQVLLSMQLAFAVIPLIHFVSDKKKMGNFAISPLTKLGAWIVAAIIVVLNLKLFLDSVGEWMQGTESTWIKCLIILFVAFIAVVLLITIIYPFILQRREANINVHENIEATLSTKAKPFEKIALALDYGKKDRLILQYGLQFSEKNTVFVLIHVVESASAQLIGEQAHDYETRKDQANLDKYVQMIRDAGYEAHGYLGYKHRAKEIARIAREHECDLLIIGSHGHTTAKDFIYGETINTVRHLLPIPVFIAR